MSKNSESFHGSDLEKIEEIFGIPKDKIIGFGSNVNPLGLSDRLKNTLCDHIDVITKYPDRDYSKLRNAIASYCKTNFEYITVGNGSTELISLFIQVANVTNALIIAPTYSEYEREISLNGGSYSYFSLEESNDFKLDKTKLFTALSKEINLLVLCNPNNPTSTAISQVDLKDIITYCKQHQILVMVDETYIEFSQDYDSIATIPFTNTFDNVIVLRGVSKFFAAPGIRLGYAITSNMELLSKVNVLKNPWSLNALADIAGQIMLTDDEYIKKTQLYIQKQRNLVVQELMQIDGLQIFTPTANFVLVKIEKENRNAADLFTYAIKKCYMIRNCSSFPQLGVQFFRICFMLEENNLGLIQCIREYMK